MAREWSNHFQGVTPCPKALIGPQPRIRPRNQAQSLCQPMASTGAARPEARVPLPNHAVPSEDPTEMLKRDLEATRLPPELREQILAELPPPEERTRMYRELIENGGLSFEECFGPLFAELEGQK